MYNKLHNHQIAKADLPCVIKLQTPVNLRALRGIEFSPPVSPEALPSSVTSGSSVAEINYFYRKHLKETQRERSQHQAQHPGLFLFARNESKSFLPQDAQKPQKADRP